jgi:serine/threonine-protein kinase greatwall
MRCDILVHSNLYIVNGFAVVMERNALALSHSPFCIQLFYSLQTSHNIYLVSLRDTIHVHFYSQIYVQAGQL